MSIEVKRILFYVSWETYIDLMTDEELRRFNKNLIRFAKNEQIELLTTGDKMVWAGVLPILQNNQDKYEKQVEKNKQNGKLGGRPKKEENPNNPNGFSETQNNPNGLLNNQMGFSETQNNPKKDECREKKDECREMNDECREMNDERVLDQEENFEIGEISFSFPFGEEILIEDIPTNSTETSGTNICNEIDIPTAGFINGSSNQIENKNSSTVVRENGTETVNKNIPTARVPDKVPTVGPIMGPMCENKFLNYSYKVLDSIDVQNIPEEERSMYWEAYVQKSNTYMGIYN